MLYATAMFATEIKQVGMLSTKLKCKNIQIITILEKKSTSQEQQQALIILDHNLEQLNQNNSYEQIYTQLMAHLSTVLIFIIIVIYSSFERLRHFHILQDASIGLN